MTSCTSTPSEPDLYWTSFPDPIDSEGNSVLGFDEINETVLVPLWYWKKIINYVINTENNINVLQNLRD